MKNSKRMILTMAGCSLLMGGASFVLVKQANDIPVATFKTEELTYLKTLSEDGSYDIKITPSSSNFLTEAELKRKPLLETKSAPSWSCTNGYAIKGDDFVERNEYEATYSPVDITNEEACAIADAFVNGSLEHATVTDIDNYCSKNNMADVKASTKTARGLFAVRDRLDKFGSLEEQVAFDKMTVTKVDYDNVVLRDSTEKEKLENYLLCLALALVGGSIGGALNQSIEERSEKKSKEKVMKK